MKKFRKQPRSVAVLRDPKYKAWLRENFGCIVCARLGVPLDSFCGRTEAAHTEKTNGIGSKGPDSGCAPVGKGHHRELHNIGMKEFCRKYRLDLPWWASVFYSQYMADKMNGVIAEKVYGGKLIWMAQKAEMP